MNRSSKIKTVSFFILLSVLMILPGGCSFWRDKDYGQKALFSEDLHEIEPLQLTEAQEEQPPEPNESEPPAQMSISLEQCRAWALSNNLDLQTQLISPTIAAEQLDEERAKFEASFNTNVSFQKTDSPSVGYLDEITGSQRETTSISSGIDLPLRTGGTLSFDLSDYMVKTDAVGTFFNPYYSTGASFSLSQPLLRNAGRRMSMYSINVSKLNQRATDARTKLEVINVIAAIDRVYWRLYAARKQLEVRLQQYELSKMQLAQAERLVELEVAAEVEILRAEAAMASQLEAIIGAENSVRDRERELKRVINRAGLPMDGATVLIPMSEPDPVRYELESEKLVAEALENRTELLELELRIIQDTMTVDYMRNQVLPLATLSYTYNIDGLGDSRESAYDLLFNSTFAGHRFGLQMVIPLGNEAAQSRLKQSIYQKKQDLISKKNQQAMIEMSVLSAIDQVEANWLRIEASRSNAILQGRLYEAEQRQFELGMRTSTEVFDAQTSYANAQNSEIAALTEYQIALVDLAYATGTLLGAAKIHWQPIVP